MTKYPLTYAVFFRSLIKPFTKLNQHVINCILLTGSPEAINSNDFSFTSTKGNGYTTGDKPIKQPLIQHVSSTSLEELSLRFDMLALRDMPAISETAKKLLSILDISDGLRTKLLNLADTESTQILLSTLLKQAVQIDNQEKKLTTEERSFLHSLKSIDGIITTPTMEGIISQISPGNIPDPRDNVPMLSEADLDCLLEEMMESFSDPESEMVQKEPFSRWEEHTLSREYFSEIFPSLPNGIFKGFLKNDIQIICRVPDNKIPSQDLPIGFLEVLCTKNNFSILKDTIAKIQHCSGCVVHVLGDLDLDARQVASVVKTLKEQFLPDAVIRFHKAMDEAYDGMLYIRAVCYLATDAPIVTENLYASSDSESKSADPYDELERLLKKYRYQQSTDHNFIGEYAFWKKLNLPDDFEMLISHTAALIMEPSLINLDWADVADTCDLDIKTKTPRTGHVELLETSCSTSDLTTYKNALQQLKNCTQCLIQIVGGDELDLTVVEEITSILQNAVSDDTYIIQGVRIDPDYTGRFHIQVLCHIEEQTEPNIQSNKSSLSAKRMAVTENLSVTLEAVVSAIDQVMDSVVIDKSTDTKDEPALTAPDFMMKKS